MNFFAFGLLAFASFFSLACAGTGGKMYRLYAPQVPGGLYRCRLAFSRHGTTAWPRLGSFRCSFKHMRP